MVMGPPLFDKLVSQGEARLWAGFFARDRAELRE